MSDPDRWREIDALLEQALDLPPGDRRAFIEEATADPEVRDRVMRLLRAAEDSEGFLEDREDVVRELAEALGVREEGGGRDDADRTGDRIGPFRVTERIGRGGMATVYGAERVEGGFEQRVALKVIRRGLDTEDVVRRFEAERDILSSLEHPHIARLLDGGATEDGLPWLAMERVDGLAITAWCDQKRMGVDARLALFLEVTEAVAHAHRSLVVHRDLKPSNILVDEGGRVLLLDFGIAKLLSDEPGDGLTRTGRRWMTPGCAAPEQIDGGAVTTATDVYQLGVLLYELLTGRKPFPVAGRTSGEVERAILRDDPTRPSRVVGEVIPGADAEDSRPVTPAEVGWARGVEPQVLRKALDGDLDAILLKTLRKEPGDRYASVDALGEDIRRYRASRPVEARRGGRTYRARKFMRRNRGAVASAAVIVLLLVGYAATATVLGARVAEERDRARAESAKAAEVTAFLESLLGAEDPRVAQGDSVTIRDVLERGVERVEEELAGQPDVQAELFFAMGKAYRGLGNLDRADSLVSRALEIRRELDPDGPSEEVSEVQTELAYIRIDRAEFESAEAIMREALDQRLALAPDGEESIAEDMVALADAIRTQGRFAEAEPLYIRAMEIYDGVPAPNRVGVAVTLNNVGLLYHEWERLDRAEPYYAEAVEMIADTLGDRHPWTLTLKHNYAGYQRTVGRYAAADSLFGEIVDTEMLVEPNSINAAAAIANQAMTWWLRGRYEAADSGFARSLDIMSALPPDHPAVTLRMYNHAEVLRDQGRWDEALALLEETKRRRIQRAGPEGGINADAQMGRVMMAAGRWQEAERLLSGVVDARRAQFDGPHPWIADAVEELSVYHGALGHAEEAEALLEEALAMRRESEGGERMMVETLVSLAGVRRERGDTAGAREALDEAAGIVARTMPPGGAYWAVTELERARLLVTRGQASEALEVVDDLAPWFERQFTPSHPRRAQLAAVRGEALTGLDRFAEAEPLLLAADTVLDRNPAEGEASARRLVALYEGWGRPGDAAPHRDRLTAADGR